MHFYLRNVMSRPKHQHYVPKVYLRQFLENNGSGGSYVWCYDFSNKFESRPRRLGIDDKVFTEVDYYTDSRYTDPLVFERSLLAGFHEPTYVDIMRDVLREQMTPATVEALMNWLSLSKSRSPIMRELPRYWMESYYRIAHKMQGIALDDAEQQRLKEHIEATAKRAQLDSMSDSEQAIERMQDHIATLNAKQWRVLRSHPDMPFWTNDNPGFSPNMHPAFAVDRPFHHTMELNAGSEIYYVLSPKYCLEITPFFAGTPLTVCALNMEIPFEDATPMMVDFVNQGVYHTRHKLLIADRKKIFDRCLRVEKRPKPGAVS